MDLTASVRRWITIDLVAFVALYLLVLALLGDKIGTVSSIGYFQLIVLGLATYRLANVISTERAAKPLRAPFVNEVEQEGKTVEVPKRHGFLGATGLLLYCPSCSGVWTAALLLYFYFFWPYPTLVFALIFALSAIERIIANASNLVRTAAVA